MDKMIAAAKLFGTEGAKKLAGDMVSFVEMGLPRVYTDVTSKRKIDSEVAYEEYVKKVYAKYSKSKTILYRNEEKELSSFFEPPFLRKEETHFNRTPEKVIISSENIEEIFKQGGHSKILITGIGGTGKTVLLKHLCVNSIVTYFKIPVFISLHCFNKMDLQDEPLERLIYERLEINGFLLPYEYFKYSLNGGKYIFLFDAYDEISEERRRMLTKKISDFTERYSDNYFVMTSRPVDQVYGLDAYTIFELCPMDIVQVERLILKLEFDAITKKKFVNELKTGLYKKYESLASIPLTLSVLYITYVQNTTIPETLQEFYEKAFDMLLYQHDILKEGYERVLKSKLSRHEFKEIFIQFCFKSYFLDEYSFSETRLIERISDAVRKVSEALDVNAYKDDLVDVTCMLIRDGREYIFLHRSFQEYFAAYYVSRMLEEKQKRFCAALLYRKDLFKVSEFLSMLKNIETNRFFNVVLLPIFKKIHRIYLETECDLIKTAAQLYVVQLDNRRVLGSEYDLFHLSTINGKNALLPGEFVALRFYYYDPLFFDFESEPITEEFMQKHFHKALVEFDKHKKILPTYRIKYNQRIVTSKSQRECYRVAISLTNSILKKYDEFVARKPQKLTFYEMLDQY